jgi:hypothetical protein
VFKRDSNKPPLLLETGIGNVYVAIGRSNMPTPAGNVNTKQPLSEILTSQNISYTALRQA